MRLGSLCSGVGALDLGLEHGLGATPVWQVETDSYCRSVLARHWPTTERLEDVRSVGAATLAPVDCVAAGFPCQPASVAGKRKAQADERWLWPQVARIVEELCPPLCVFENVLGLRTAGMRDVLSDLAALGFDVEWSDLSAFELGAPHLRRRLFFVASHPERVELRQQPGWLERACRTAGQAVNRYAAEVDNSNALRLGQQEARIAPGQTHDDRRRPADPDSLRRLEQAWCVATERGWPIHRGWRFDCTPRVDDVPARGLVGPMRKAAGNAVVTACAFVVGRAIKEALSIRQEAA